MELVMKLMTFGCELPSLVSSLILNPAKLRVLGLHTLLSSPPKELQSNDPRLILPSTYTLTPFLSRIPTVRHKLTSGSLYVSIDQSRISQII